MKKFIYFAIFILISFSLCADWDPTESHGMHYPQMPDPTGYDVDCNDPRTLADDFLCTQSGPINEVHIWISQRGQTGEPIPPQITNIHLSIHTDIPAGVQEPWSMPGELLWSGNFNAAEFIIREPAYEGLQGWFDPWIPELILGDHLWYWQVNIEPILDPFIQEEGIIYWLDVTIDSPEELGWKTSLDHWNDDAVFYDENNPPYFWRELIDPEPPNESLDLAFVIGGDDFPKPVELSSFYATYINGIPTLYWTTQTETNNEYWNVYRGNSNEFSQASLLNDGDPIAGQGTTLYSTDYIYVDETPVVQNTTYWYWIESVATDGESEVHVPITLSIPYEDTPITPDTYGLHQNYPNPFNPSTSISFALAEDSDVELIIYNVKGEVIRSIFNNHVYANDITSVVWDGNDADGKQVSSGVYFYKLITNTKEYQKKMLLVK